MVTSTCTVTLEGHFVSHDSLNATGALGHSTTAGMHSLRETLLDLGPLRLAAMDEAAVDL